MALHCKHSTIILNVRVRTLVKAITLDTIQDVERSEN